MNWLVDRSNASSRTEACHHLADHVARFAEAGVEVDRQRITEACDAVLDELCDCMRDVVQLRLDWSATRPVVVVCPAPDHEPGPCEAGGRCHRRRTLGLDVLRPMHDRFVIGPVDRTSPPASEDVEADGSIGQQAFVKALLAQLTLRVEGDWGPAAIDAALTKVGGDVGNRMEDEYRRARHLVERLEPDQIADLFVRLKGAIDGDFYVIECTSERIVLGNRRCPFGRAAVQRSPALCRMTSSVFGGIAARNTGYSSVRLERRIAAGDPECLVTVMLRPAGAEQRDAQQYGIAPSSAPAAVSAGGGDVVDGPRSDERTRPAGSASPDPLDVLSDREREVLALVAEALSNQAIADRLYVSKSAVEKHLQGIFHKLGLTGEAGRDRRMQAALLFHRSTD